MLAIPSEWRIDFHKLFMGSWYAKANSRNIIRDTSRAHLYDVRKVCLNKTLFIRLLFLIFVPMLSFHPKVLLHPWDGVVSNRCISLLFGSLNTSSTIAMPSLIATTLPFTCTRRLFPGTSDKLSSARLTRDVVFENKSRGQYKDGLNSGSSICLYCNQTHQLITKADK
jgi:hypothetical protein